MDNFIPAMKRCDVYGGGPTPEAARGTEGVTVGAVRPGDTRIAFPTLAERAQAAALATARGATAAACDRFAFVRPGRRTGRAAIFHLYPLEPP